MEKIIDYVRGELGDTYATDFVIYALVGRRQSGKSVTKSYAQCLVEEFKLNQKRWRKKMLEKGYYVDENGYLTLE